MERMPKLNRLHISYLAEPLDAEEVFSEDDSRRSMLEAIAGRWIDKKMIAMRRSSLGLLAIVFMDWTVIVSVLDFHVCGRTRIWGIGAEAPAEADADSFLWRHWPAIILIVCLLGVMTAQMSLWNFSLVKRVLKEPYAVLTILEVTGFCLSYGATFCWGLDACSTAFSLWSGMLTACLYDTLTVKARKYFKWYGPVFVVVLQFICFCLLFRTTPSICVSSKFWDYPGSSGSTTVSGACSTQSHADNATTAATPSVKAPSWDLVGVLGLNYIDLTLGYAGSVTLLFFRMIYLAFGKGPARCCLITCPIKVTIVQEFKEEPQNHSTQSSSSSSNTQMTNSLQDDKYDLLSSKSSSLSGPPPGIQETKLESAPNTKTSSLDSASERPVHQPQSLLIPLRIRRIPVKDTAENCLAENSESRENVTNRFVIFAQTFLDATRRIILSIRRFPLYQLPFERQSRVCPDGKTATLVTVRTSHANPSALSERPPQRTEEKSSEPKEDSTLHVEPNSFIASLSGRSSSSSTKKSKKHRMLRRKLIPHFTSFKISSHSKDRLICLCFGETLGLKYLHWRYRWKAVIDPISLISHFVSTIGPFTALMSGPRTKNITWPVPLISSLITLENSMALFNSSVIKFNLQSFDFWFSSLKAGLMLTALSGIFCWEPQYALFYFGNVGGIFGTISRDAVPFPLRQKLRFSTLTTVCGVGLLVSMVYYGAVEGSYCLNDRFSALSWLRLAGQSDLYPGSSSSGAFNCSSSSSGIGTNITPWTSLRSSTTWTDRVLTMKMSWREMLLNNSLTFLFLCINYVLSDLWFRNRLAIVVAPTSLEEVHTPLAQEETKVNQ